MIGQSTNNTNVEIFFVIITDCTELQLFLARYIPIHLRWENNIRQITKFIITFRTMTFDFCASLNVLFERTHHYMRPKRTRIH
ncbi:hypothetical protein LCGC14_2024140 [marine sediment metagenome]|uniref:Uncharacterized protein n=1 Tax=marine sediment metagenome TaxID=412755 RepID=A0A0F9FJ47_9ZZZZ